MDSRKEEENTYQKKFFAQSARVPIQLKKKKKPFPDFSSLPKEMLKEIFSYANTEELNNWRKTCKLFKNIIDGFIKPQKFFYGVAGSINLYEMKYHGFYYQPYGNPHAFGYSGYSSSYRHYNYKPYEAYRDITNEDLTGAFFKQKKMFLFPNLESAEVYSKYTSSHRYNSKQDIFESTETKPIFVVNIKDEFALEKKVETISDSWVRNSPHPPEVTTKKVTTYQSAINNIKQSFFVDCNGSTTKFYEKKNNTTEKFAKEFTPVWEKAFNKVEKNDLDRMSIDCVAALFKTYTKPLFSFFTRHANNRAQVTNILIDLNNPKKITSLDNVYELLNAKFKIANEKGSGVIKNGHYFNMLKFALEQLEELRELKKLDSIQTYLKP